MNCLRSLERWDRGFESRSRHGCLFCVRLFCVCVVLCVGSGLATGWFPVQGIIPSAYRIKKLKNRPRPNKGLYSHNNNNNNNNNNNSYSFKKSEGILVYSLLVYNNSVYDLIYLCFFYLFLVYLTTFSANQMIAAKGRMVTEKQIGKNVKGESFD
jgi:hypothetical protein